MILLDTNVVSEPLRASPDPRVVAWIDEQPLETLFLSAVGVAELRFGVACLPVGRKRKALGEQLETRVLPLFAGRVLAFDLIATRVFADLMAQARKRGSVIGLADGLLAATAAAQGMMVATRDTAPFVAAGLRVIDPWQQR